MDAPDTSAPQLPARCLACDAPLHGVYCHSCGQGHRYPRLRIKALAEDFLDGIVNLDSRVVRTVWGLTIDPGRVVREYLDGRRVIYINPFKYALFTVTVAFVVVPWLSALPSFAPVIPQTNTSLLPEWAKLLNVAALPLQALLMQLLFWRHGLRWIEHFVLVMFALGHTFLLQTLLATPALLLGDWASVGTALVPIVWMGWSARGVMGTGWASSLARAFISFAVMQATTMGLVALIGVERLAAGS